QLSQIVVHIHDEKESGELFPSVLLSLSGEDGYRNNSISSAGGTFSFVDLFPGSFYLRPLLKEYSFSPAAVAIELESGESKVVKFLATRVAYSEYPVLEYNTFPYMPMVNQRKVFMLKHDQKPKAITRKQQLIIWEFPSKGSSA
ncbi:nodal modulator, partial [Musa troglodytarum]